MTKKSQQTDHFSWIILAAFLILSASHLYCRFDVSCYIEGMFVKAWAGQSDTTSVPVSSASQVVMPQKIQPNVANVSTTTGRNPFMVPARLLTPTTTPSTNGGNNNATSYASATPVLRGIVASGTTKLAIIEFNNSSNYYKNGQTIGEYTLNSIGSNSVELGHPQNSLHLTLGRNN